MKIQPAKKSILFILNDSRLISFIYSSFWFFSCLFMLDCVYVPVYLKNNYPITIIILRVFLSSIHWWSFTGVWVRVGLQDSSQYSSRSQQYCSLDGLDSSLSRLLEIVLSTPNPIDFPLTFNFHSFFSSLTRSKYLSIFRFLWFSLWCPPERQNLQNGKFSFSFGFVFFFFCFWFFY